MTTPKPQLPSERIEADATENAWEGESVARDLKWPADMAAAIGTLVSRVNATARYLDEQATARPIAGEDADWEARLLDQYHQLPEDEPGYCGASLVCDKPPGHDNGCHDLAEPNDLLHDRIHRDPGVARAAVAPPGEEPANCGREPVCESEGCDLPALHEHGHATAAELQKWLLRAERHRDRLVDRELSLTEERDTLKARVIELEQDSDFAKYHVKAKCYGELAYKWRKRCIDNGLAHADDHILADEWQGREARIQQLESDLSEARAALTHEELTAREWAERLTKLEISAPSYVRKLEKELADEKAAHEMTRRALSDTEHEWRAGQLKLAEQVAELRKRDAVVEAARELSAKMGPDGHMSWPWSPHLARLRAGLSALDRTEGEPTAAPPIAAPKVPERPAIDFGDDGGAVFYRVERWTKEELERAREEGERLHAELCGDGAEGERAEAPPVADSSEAVRVPLWCECEEFGQSVAIPCATGTCPTAKARYAKEAAAKPAEETP